MRAIWRKAAAIQAPRFSRQKCASRFTTAAPPIARKRYSYKRFGRSGDFRQTMESLTTGADFPAWRGGAGDIQFNALPVAGAVRNAPCLAPPADDGKMLFSGASEPTLGSSLHATHGFWNRQ